MQNNQEKEYLNKASKIIFGSGIILFLISLINGFLIQLLCLPRLGLSAHLIGLIGASFLFGIGSYWSRLNLSPRTSKIGMVLLIYSFCVGWAVYFAAAALGAGKMFPIASQNKAGTSAVEGIIGIFMLSFVLTFLISFIILLKGLSSEKK
jgi:hydroxylaminobenzene mutase